MIRARFKANADDYRPVKFPPPYPYWCSGYSLGADFELSAAIVIAYADSEAQIFEYWPEATDLDAEDAAEVQFSDRFPKPDWWKP